MNLKSNAKLVLISALLYFAPYFVNRAGTVPSKSARLLHPPFLFLSILKTNLTAILGIILGGFLFGVPTLVIIVSNGFVHSYYFFESVKLNEEILFFHCIFEIPAIIIAGAAGFKIPYEIVRYLAGRKETVLTRGDIKEYLTLALISVILIVIAAWIEANVTLRIAKAMLNSTKGI